MTTLQVIEIVRRLDQGMTKPFLVHTEDDALYVAKGRETTQRGLMQVRWGMAQYSVHGRSRVCKSLR